MIRFNRFNQRAALGALLVCFSLGASADEIQDANKLFKHGQAAQALNKIDAILSSQPKDIQARFLKGVILSEQNQTDEAINVFMGLNKDYPELPEPYNNLAVLYAGQGQYEKAKVALEMALHTHPSYATAHENLGDIYAKMASQAYDRALQLDRSNVSSKTKLALIKELPPVALKVPTASIQVAALAAPTSTAPVTAKPVPTVTASPVAASTTSASTPTTVKAKEVVSESGNHNDEVLKTLQSWAKAWSARNANSYLALYAKNFQTPNNETRSSWQQQRRERISKPQPIVVTVSNAKVKLLDENHASVSFIQSYHSGSLNSTTHKTLVMAKNSGQWQIQAEQSGQTK
jgi:tetratricopeptide (TPR) repeat protein